MSIFTSEIVGEGGDHLVLQNLGDGDQTSVGSFHESSHQILVILIRINEVIQERKDEFLPDLEDMIRDGV